MQVTHVMNNRAKKKVIFTFLVFKQNIDAQFHMNMKNHHHHVNYLNFNYAIFCHLVFFYADSIFGK